MASPSSASTDNSGAVDPNVFAKEVLTDTPKKKHGKAGAAEVVKRPVKAKSPAAEKPKVPAVSQVVNYGFDGEEEGWKDDVFAFSKELVPGDFGQELSVATFDGATGLAGVQGQKFVVSAQAHVPEGFNARFKNIEIDTMENDLDGFNLATLAEGARSLFVMHLAENDAFSQEFKEMHGEKTLAVKLDLCGQLVTPALKQWDSKTAQNARKTRKDRKSALSGFDLEDDDVDAGAEPAEVEDEKTNADGSKVSWEQRLKIPVPNNTKSVAAKRQAEETKSIRWKGTPLPVLMYKDKGFTANMLLQLAGYYRDKRTRTWTQRWVLLRLDGFALDDDADITVEDILNYTSNSKVADAKRDAEKKSQGKKRQREQGSAAVQKQAKAKTKSKGSDESE